MAALYNTRRWYIRQYVLANAKCAYACACARASRQVCVHMYTDIQSRVHICIYIRIYVYIYIDTTERSVLFTARGRYCRQERLSGAHNPFARSRARDGWTKTAVNDEGRRHVVLHPVLGLLFDEHFAD